MGTMATWAGTALVAVAGLAAGEGVAQACGGCFVQPPPPTQTASDITDERMLLTVSSTQSTLYDQIRYSGNPSLFAWVLPIQGTVDVGLSADVLFATMDALTATQIVAPPQNCPPAPNCGGSGGGGCGAASLGAGFASNDSVAGSEPPPVTVLKQQIVGPYDTVQLHSTDTSALEAWLAQNQFVIPADSMPVLAAYVAEGFDFLAMKLQPGDGVQAMRPVRVTSHGASLSLPMRMASIGTGATVGITVWVVADGRYEPQNYPFFHIDDTKLVWDFAKEQSNYALLRTQGEAPLKGAGWEIESSISVAQVTVNNAILAGGQVSRFTAPPPVDATEDYLAVGGPGAPPDAGDDGGASSSEAGAEAGVPPVAYQSADEVRAADLAALFAGIAGPNARITRMRSDLAHAAMDKDFVLQASSDQSEMSNVRNVVDSVNLTCPSYAPCSPGCATSTNAASGVETGFGVGLAWLGLSWGRIARRLRARRSR